MSRLTVSSPGRASRAGGFSLVELMVAMTLSLVLLAGALSILYSSRLTFTENERLARIQEAGRTTMELIMRDLRSAGFQGCSRPVDPDDFQNALVNPTTLLWNFTAPIQGYDANAGAWTPALDALVPLATTGSDVLVIRTTRQGQPMFRTNAATAAVGTISVDVPPGASIPDNTTMLIGDCRFSTVFLATGYAPAGATAQITHTDVGANPANATTSLNNTFLVDATVVPVDTVIYYVRPGTNGPALWQRVGAQNPQLLIEGVENLQIRYGVDTNGDLVVDQYVAAAAGTNWANVISVSIAALIRSEVESGVERDSRTYSLLGTNVGPFNDRRQRSIFTTTVALRNRAS
jgi:type IV pilus assembly protein PilW